MNAAEYNKRELEQGRLTWVQLQVLCDYQEIDLLKRNVLAGLLSWDQITEAVKVFQRRQGLVADGMAGPGTRGRVRVDMASMQFYEPGYQSDIAPISSRGSGDWKPFDGPMVRQPRNRQEVLEMYGDPGTLAENKEWSRRNLVECHAKLGNRLPGVPERWWVSVHRVVEPYLREALRRTLVSAPGFVIEVLGSHNWRPIRGKLGNPLSMHAWGLAVDINASVNRGVDFPKGHAPQMGTPAWDKVWPPDSRRITKEVVAAFRSCGFAWGADWDEDGLTSDESFCDVQHFEHVARDGKSIDV